MLRSVDPATGEIIAEHGEMSPGDVMAAVDRAHDAFLRWRRTTFRERHKHVMAAARTLRERVDVLARLMAMEMGKPVREGRAEVEKCAWVCEHYAESAERYLAAEQIGTDASRSYVVYRPLGVILAVMPWNFPFWQVFRFAAPALMAGNSVVLKHASNVQGCARAIEEVFRETGIPESIFTNLPVGSAGVRQVIEHPLVRAVTLTGSGPAGSEVAAAAGRSLKKCVLELGGSDPLVVLEDADLDLAAERGVTSRLINTGQSCIAAKRFIVVNAVHDRFVDLVVERMAAVSPGDPLDPDTIIGPLARHDLRDDLHRQVTESVDAGADILLGGEIPGGKGAFYPPTVLTGVTPGMPAFDEELFGPVAAVVRAEDEEDALHLANATSFGLGAAVFTRDTERGERIAVEVFEAGCCFVNDLVRSDPRLPFGGVKASGFGRELGPHGIREFVNAKTVWVR